MEEIKLISKCSTYGEVIALLERKNDYVIAVGFDEEKMAWENGYYFLKFSCSLDSTVDEYTKMLNEKIHDIL